MTFDSPDVCVVGAGVAGAVLARTLAERDHDVVVLGPGPGTDAGARGRRARDRARAGGDAAERWGLGFGGTARRWSGVASRFRPRDFETATRDGVGRDWPISYEDLRPDYRRAERELNVAGDADAPCQPPRDEPFPLAPLDRSRSDELLARAADRLGVATHPLPNAHAADAGGRGAPDRTRADGAGHGAGAGVADPTPIGPAGPDAGADIAAVHAQRAVAAGARVVDRASVQRLEHGPDGERVTAAVYATPDGETHRQAADLFVVASGAVETSRLLLSSASPQFPDGLANSSGALGRYLLCQPPAAVVGYVDAATRQGSVGRLTTGSGQFADAGGADHGGFAVTFMNDAGRAPAEIALERRSWGDQLRDEVAFEYGNALGVRFTVESLPRADNRVELDASRTGDRGTATATVDVSPGRYAAAAQERALDVGRALVEELDGGVVSAGGTATTDDPPPAAVRGCRPLGGARMGTDPAESVVDPNLETHDLSNLYVTGPSAFVTSGATNPALTVAALSLRAAADVHDRLT